MTDMKDHGKWVSSKMRLGWALLVSGVLGGVMGILLQTRFGNEAFNFRLVTGAGILLIGLGAARLFTYRRAMRNADEARRLKAQATDERTVLIRRRAGNRAFFVSAVMVYTALLWSSFASNDWVPELAGDTLWYYLAAATVIPLAVYIVSIVVDEQNL